MKEKESKLTTNYLRDSSAYELGREHAASGKPMLTYDEYPYEGAYSYYVRGYERTVAESKTKLCW